MRIGRASVRLQQRHIAVQKSFDTCDGHCTRGLLVAKTMARVKRSMVLIQGMMRAWA